MRERVSARDLFGRPLNIGDLVVYGHSGRYASTRVARVYNVDNPKRVRVRIIEKSHGDKWVKAGTSVPYGIVKVDETDLSIPTLSELNSSPKE